MKMVCATDLMPKSDAAIHRAGILADHLGAQLTLLHVLVPNNAERDLEQTLQTAVGRIKSRVQPPSWRARHAPNVTIRPGNPARLILEILEQAKPRLLILGPHHKRALRDVLEGTIAEKALAARTCPVLVVRREPRAPYRRVLLALDVSDASASAVRAAVSLVLTSDVEAQIVHAYQPPYDGMPLAYAGNWHRQTARAVRNMLEYERANYASCEIRIEHGKPAAAILRAIERYEPDLLVMGTRGLGRFRRAVLGSVANSVLHAVTCDTLIVPDGSFRASRRDGLVGGRRLRLPMGTELANPTQRGFGGRP